MSETTICPGCQRLQGEVETLRQQIAELQSSVALLQEQLAAARKTSSTSSKPPSSDIVKPKPPANADGDKRTIGGQPGHPMHQRQPFPSELVTRFVEHHLPCCPCCGGELRLCDTIPRVVQQVDVQKPPLVIEQHTCPQFWCGHCQKPYWAPMPEHIKKGGLVGPDLTALIAFMKGGCHASFSTIRTFLRDVVQVTISRSHLVNIIKKVTKALDGPYEELLKLLPGEPVVNVDETGHRCQGDRWWTWCFRAELYTLYHIDGYRNAEVLMGILGKEFAGVVGCDYFSTYRRYMRVCSVELQFCLAHLIRDVKFLTTLPDARDRAYGERLRAALKRLFEVIHQRESLGKATFQKRLKAAKEEILQAGMNNVPPTRHSQNMEKRFKKHGEAYFTFITTPGVEPTNNLAEQAIRFVVIDRLITQGTRSAKGQRFSERIWTVMATCVQQGKSVYEFLREAVKKWFGGEEGPSLVPAGSQG